MYKIIGIAAVIAFFGMLFGNKNNDWSGFYYPAGDTSAPIYSPIFKDKDECIHWGESMIRSRPQDKEILPQELYECGRACKRMDEADPFSIRICEQNFDGGDARRGEYDE